MSDGVERLRGALKSLAINSAPGNGLSRRSEERKQVEVFLRGCLSGGGERAPVCRSLYICGPPGTGKTALVRDVLQSCGDWAVRGLCAPEAKRRCTEGGGPECGVQTLFLDCVADPHTDSAERILEWLARSVCRGGREAPVRRLDAALKSCAPPPVVLVMDEVDDLLGLHDGRALLFRLCKWAAAPRGRLTFIGIGNDLGLVRSLGAAFPGASCLPRVLRFPAYRAEDIRAILDDRVGRFGVYERAFLALVAARTEKMCCDLRVALAMCREPLVRAYTAYRRTGAPPAFPLKLSAVNPVVSELVDNTQSLIGDLPSLQKLFLAALYAASHSRGAAGLRAALKADVYAAYTQICALLGNCPEMILSMLVLFRECVGPLEDLHFIAPRGCDHLELAVDPAELLAALCQNDSIIYNALVSLCPSVGSS